MSNVYFLYMYVISNRHLVLVFLDIKSTLYHNIYIYIYIVELEKIVRTKLIKFRNELITTPNTTR